MTGPDAWANAMAALNLFALDPLGFGGLAVRAHAGPVRDVFLDIAKQAMPPDTPWLRLPATIDDESLLGGFDIVSTLKRGRMVPQAGLLARAHGGIVVAPQGEAISLRLAGRIGAAMDTHAVRAERSGLSHVWPARFGLVLLDESESDGAAPSALMERCAFWIDLDGVSVRDAVAPAPRKKTDRATATIDAISTDETEIVALCEAAAALGVDPPCAALFALRAARAWAAIAGRDHVITDDLAAAAALVLAPRATRQPRDDRAEEPQQPEPESGPAPAVDPDDAQALGDVVIAAAAAAIPARLLATLTQDAKAKAQGGGVGAARASVRRGRPIGVRSGEPKGGARLALLETLLAAAPWQAMRRATGSSGDRMIFARSDLRIRRFAERREASVVFVVDASGSAAFQRLGEVKGAIELLLTEAYVARTHAALVTFRKDGAEVLLPPTRSVARARALLADLPGGGATPLAAGLETGLRVALAERAKGRSVLTVVMSDGRGNVGRDGAHGRAAAMDDAQAVARLYRSQSISCVFVDTSRWPAPESAAFAGQMGARYTPLPFADAGALRAQVVA
jgi:magnesium chelatase subunit D